MAGLIYGFYQHKAPEEVVEFATAAAFSKLFIASDATTLQPEEIKAKVKATNPSAQNSKKLMMAS